jgi:acyl-CoA thioesterase-1
MKISALLLSISLLALCACSPTQVPPDEPADPATPPGSQTGSVIFIGDSITNLWEDIPGVNAGINGQTTAQMLARFQADVLDKRPAVVVIMGGTNDIYIEAMPTVDKVSEMADMAAASGACVIIGRLLPIYFQAGEKSLEQINAEVLVWNQDIDMLAKSYGYRVAEYFALFDGKPELFQDGLHPNEQGYQLMRGVVQPLIDSCKAATGG